MAATEMNTEIRSDVEPERVGLVWMDAEQAMIARWRGEPTVERLASDVPPKRQAMGSVRRGPARRSGGGRVPGHGTEGRHRDLLRRYFADLVGRVADLDVIEVTGRGLPYRQFAELFRQLASRRNADVEVRTRRMSRRPTEPQLAARLREMVGEQLPRRTAGSNQWTEARERPRRADARAFPATSLATRNGVPFRNDERSNSRSRSCSLTTRLPYSRHRWEEAAMNAEPPGPPAVACGC